MNNYTKYKDTKNKFAVLEADYHKNKLFTKFDPVIEFSNLGIITKAEQSYYNDYFKNNYE